MGIAPLAPADPERIAGYRLYGRLGAGGQGVVYQGHSERTGLVAVKALHATWLSDAGARSRLVKEVAAARRVAPFCTARVLEADLDGEVPYVVSEFIPGPSLAEHVRTQGPLVGTALDRLAVGTMTALLAIHEAGLVHRDLKPANVILGPDGPRVVDFGIARDLNGHLSGTTGMMGTPTFMAPEQVNGQPLTPAADLFAWAVMMVHAATGVSPFEAEHVSAVLYRVVSAPVDLSGVPARLAAVLETCLAKDPAGRPTAQQVLLQLIGSPAAAAPGPATWAPGAGGDGTTALLARAATMVGSPTVAVATSPQPRDAGPDTAPDTGPDAGPGQDGPGRRGRGAGRGSGRGGGRWPAVLAAVGVLALLGSGALVAWDRLRPPPVAPLHVVGAGPTIPGEFAGTWTGGLAAKSGQNWFTRLTLPDGATVGEQSVNTCRYVLTLQEIDKDRLTLTFVAVPTVRPDSSCGEPAWLTVERPRPSGDASPPASEPFTVRMTSIRSSDDTASGAVDRTSAG